MTVHSDVNESVSTSAFDVAFGEVGIRLKLLREACGYSQRELAKRAGLTNSSISIIEQGQVSPSVQSLGRILAALPISLTDFFAFSLPSINPAQKISHASAHQLDARIQELSAEQVTPFHVMSVDVSGVLIQGEILLITLEAEHRLKAGDNFYIPAHQCYRLANFSVHPARLFLCSLFAHKA